MSPIGMASTVFSLLSSFGASSTSSTSQAGSAGSKADFASSLSMRIAAQRTESFDSLLGMVSGTSGKGSSALESVFSGLSDTDGKGGSVNQLLSALGLAGGSQGLSASGRNLSLFDPESAFRMMTDINNRDVTYKAQFSELSEMQEAVGEMKLAGEALAKKFSDKTLAGDDTAITAQLQAFVSQYNNWVGRFEETVQGGGLLDGTQAAEISLYELRQSVENVFNGAAGGIHGMPDIGLNIDPVTHLASLDGERLQSMLAANREGVVATVGEFGQQFAKSAELLVADNNFIPNRLDNLDRVIDYIADNKSSLQSEFGLGDLARPSALVKRALAAYERMHSA